MLISVCMCTYKRDTLRKTLDSILAQQLPQGCTLEIVVVDNDIEESGKATCEEFQAHSKDISIHYHVNGERNLSAVRNTSMEKASGDFLAFIDDDEWADSNWVCALLAAIDLYQADAIFGKVNVIYPDSSPEWIAEGDMFGKDHHATGAVLIKGATSNAILRSQWVKIEGFRFDPVFGKSGGEDTDFFHRIAKAGGKLVFDNNAVVSEVVETHRLNLEYLKKQNVRIGQTHWNYLWSKQSGVAFIKTGLFVLAQILGAGLLALISLPFGKKRYAKWYLLLVRNVVKLKTAIVGSETVELYGNN